MTENNVNIREDRDIDYGIYDSEGTHGYRRRSAAGTIELLKHMQNSL